MSEHHPFPFASAFRADRAGVNLAGDTERFRRNSRAPEPSSVVDRSFCREVSHDSGENLRPNSTFYTTPQYVIAQDRTFAGSAPSTPLDDIAGDPYFGTLSRNFNVGLAVPHRSKAFHGDPDPPRRST